MLATAAAGLRKIRVDNTDLFIVDDQVKPEIIRNFYDNAISLAYKRGEKTFAKDIYPIFSVDFDAAIFEEKTSIGATGRKLLDQLMNGAGYKLFRVYINMCHYGDVEFPHRDCGENDSDVTVLYYVNKEWQHQWGGETLFYEDGDTKAAVLPRPGRFALFYGSVEHIGSIPTRICPQSRLTLAMKYKEIAHV